MGPKRRSASRVSPDEPGARLARLAIVGWFIFSGAGLSDAFASSELGAAKRYVSSRAYYHALRAELAFARHDLRAAAEELQLALVYDPESVLLTERLARLELSNGRLRKARRLVDRARALAPRETPLLLLDAEVATKAGDLGRAERSLRRAAASAGSGASPALALARLLQGRGRLAEAVRVLSLAAARMPQAPEPLDALGEIELGRGRLHRAVAAVERAVVRAPDSLERRVQLDRLYARAGRYQHAAESWRLYLEGGEREPAAFAHAARAEFRAGETDRGRALIARWRLEAPGDATDLAVAEALAREGYYAEAVATWENRRVPTTLPVASAVSYARALIEIGRTEDAAGVLSVVGPHAPEYAEARGLMATALVRAGASSRAIEALETALTWAPHHREFGLRLGMLRPVLLRADPADSWGRAAERATRLARGAGLDAANAWLDTLTTTTAKDREARALLRTELHLRHAVQVSPEVVQTALAVEPDAPHWRAALATTLSAAGRAARGARREAERAVASAPDDPESIGALGTVLLRRGARRHAAECLERAVRISPGSAEVWESWGDLLSANGRPQSARAAFSEARRALESDPWRGRFAKEAVEARLVEKVSRTSKGRR